MTGIAKTLSAKEIEDAIKNQEDIANIALPAPASGFKFLAAFDGTMNDRDNVAASGSPLSTNVGVIEDAWNSAGAGQENVRSIYRKGPGIDQFSDALAPSDYSLRSAEIAYKEFNASATSWLKKNPGETVSIFLTAFSRGDIAAAMFTQLVYERGVVDIASGRILVPAGAVQILGGVIFDPVDTFTSDSVTYAPDTRNLLFITAQNEYRTAFKGALHQEGGTIYVSEPGAHADIGGGYDNGLGALNLDSGLGFLEKLSGVDLHLPASRLFDANSPVFIHTEGLTPNNPTGWPVYGSIDQGTVRQFVPISNPDAIEGTADGASRQVFVDFGGRQYEILRATQSDGSIAQSIRAKDQYGKALGHIESIINPDGTVHSFLADINGDDRFDQSGTYNRWGQKASAEWEGFDISSPIHYRQQTIAENGKITSLVIDGANNIVIQISNAQFSLKNSKGVHIEGTGNSISVDDSVQGTITGDNNDIYGGNRSNVEVHGRDSDVHLGEGSRARVYGDHANIYADGQDVIVDVFGSGLHYRSATGGNTVGLKGSGNEVIGSNIVVWFNGDASGNLYGNGNTLVVQGSGNFSNVFGDNNYAMAKGTGNLIAFTGQTQSIDSIGNRVWLNGNSTGYVVGDNNDLVASGNSIRLVSLGSNLNAISDGLDNTLHFTGQGINVNAVDDAVWFHEKTRGLIYGNGNTVNAAGNNVGLDAYGDWVRVNSSGQNNSIGVSGKNETVNAQGDGIWFNNGATGVIAGDFNTATANGSGSQVFVNGSYTVVHSTGDKNIFTFQGVHEEMYAESDQAWFNPGSNGGVHGDRNLVVANGAQVNLNLIGNIENVVSNASGNEFHFQGDGSYFNGNGARLLFTAGSDAQVSGLNNTIIGLDYTDFLVAATQGVLGMDATIAPIVPISVPYVPVITPVIVDPLANLNPVFPGGVALPMLGNTLNHVEPISMESWSVSSGPTYAGAADLPHIDFLGPYSSWDGEAMPLLEPLF